MKMYEEAKMIAKGLWLSFLEHKIRTDKDWEKQIGRAVSNN